MLSSVIVRLPDRCLCASRTWLRAMRRAMAPFAGSMLPLCSADCNVVALLVPTAMLPRSNARRRPSQSHGCPSLPAARDSVHPLGKQRVLLQRRLVDRHAEAGATRHIDVAILRDKVRFLLAILLLLDVEHDRPRAPA
jgi:hypothetical protein